MKGSIAHGAGLSALLPGWLWTHRKEMANLISSLGNAVFDNTLNDAQPLTAADTIRRINDFLTSLGCPVCLDDISIEPEDFPEIIDHCLYQAKIWRFEGYDEQFLLTLLHACRHPHFEEKQTL